MTPREKAIYKLMENGLSSKVIARELGMALSTVKVHRRMIFIKTGKLSRGLIQGRGQQLNTELSPMQMKVFELAITGMTNKEISEQLGNSPRTVEVHLGIVLKKLKLSRRQELIRIYGRSN